MLYCDSCGSHVFFRVCFEISRLLWLRCPAPFDSENVGILPLQLQLILRDLARFRQPLRRLRSAFSLLMGGSAAHQKMRPPGALRGTGPLDRWALPKPTLPGAVGRCPSTPPKDLRSSGLLQLPSASRLCDKKLRVSATKNRVLCDIPSGCSHKKERPLWRLFYCGSPCLSTSVKKKS